MQCPRCRQTLKPQTYEGVAIDRCLGCTGAWLDAGEIERINKTAGETFSPELAASALRSAAAGVPQSEQESVELCPKCRAQMRPVNFNYSSGIIIDACPQSHGLWFDGEELEKVQVHWEHWEKQRKEKGGAWGFAAAQAGHEARAVADQARARNQSSLGGLGRAIDRALHGIEKLRRGI